MIIQCYKGWDSFCVANVFRAACLSSLNVIMSITTSNHSFLHILVNKSDLFFSVLLWNGNLQQGVTWRDEEIF